MELQSSSFFEKKKEKQRLKIGFLKVKHLGLFRKSLLLYVKRGRI
tara:strand:- start:182 stop:316 length:135 start_codon:yes stop_codon:yes gene_type:complete